MNYINTLTAREKEILSLIIDGRSNPEIAKRLFISTHTVKAHIESIYRKIGVHNKVQAAVFALLYTKLLDISSYQNLPEKQISEGL